MTSVTSLHWILGVAMARAGGDGNGDQGAAPAVAPPAYRILRYDEDYSYLRDPSARTEWVDALKYVPFGVGGDWYASFGGEARFVYELWHHTRFEEDPPWDGYLMQRYLLHGDFHFGEHFRGFGELQDSLITGRQTPDRPTDRDATDVHQAFLEADSGAADDDWIALRVGRQEMQYGSARLISVRNGPNVRLSFDAARLLVKSGTASIDVFGGRPVEVDEHAFDDRAEDGVWIAGVYATLGPFDGVPGRFDVYSLDYNDDDAEFAQGTGHERRWSLGSRWYGGSGGWDFNFEAVGQWGSFEDGRIEAWTVASDTGYTEKGWLGSPRFGLKANAISGDHDPSDGKLGTFNAMFPKGAYFGEIGIVGPANLLNLHPSIDVALTDDLALTGDCVLYWRESTDDALYGPGGNVVRAPSGSTARYIGTQPSLIATWHATRHVNVVATVTRFQPGEFLRETGPHEPIDFFRLEFAVRF
jgi:hypothetical protein